MTSHRFDPVSALLALAAIAGGLAVAFELTDPFGDADAGVWLAVLALAVGAVVIPWGRRERVPDAGAASDESDLVDLDA